MNRDRDNNWEYLEHRRRVENANMDRSRFPGFSDEQIRRGLTVPVMNNPPDESR